MGALFNQLAIVQHQDEIGGGHRAQAMSDDNRRASQGAQFLKNLSLGHSVERIGRLVQDENRWFPREDAGERQALTLSA